MPSVPSTEFIERVNDALQSSGAGTGEASNSESATGPEVKQRRGTAERAAEPPENSRSAPAYTRKQKEAVDRYG